MFIQEKNGIKRFIMAWLCLSSWHGTVTRVKTQRWRLKSFREWRHKLKIQDSDLLKACIDATLALRKESLKKIQACMGFEPLTSATALQRSTNWANKLGIITSQFNDRLPVGLLAQLATAKVTSIINWDDLLSSNSSLRVFYISYLTIAVFTYVLCWVGSRQAFQK